MQVRLKSFTITPEDRRAIRFSNDKRKTQASREECKVFFEHAIDNALRDVRYRWNGSQQSAAELAGANPQGLATVPGVQTQNGAPAPAPAPAPEPAPEPAAATQ